MLARRWKKVSEAKKGTWVFGDDNSISFSYTAIQMIGNSLQKLYLGNPIQIQAPKESYLENPTQIQLRFSFKWRKSTALRRRRMPNSVLFSRLDDKGSNMRKVHSMKTELKTADVRLNISGSLSLISGKTNSTISTFYFSSNQEKAQGCDSRGFQVSTWNILTVLCREDYTLLQPVILISY